MGIVRYIDLVRQDLPAVDAPPPTGNVYVDTIALQRANDIAALVRRPLNLQPGVYMTSGGLVQTTNWIGAGVGAWAPVQIWGDRRDMAGTVVMVAQTPTATRAIPFTSNMDVSGGVVANESTRNANDTHYSLTDLTNADANAGTGQGATPKALTYGVRVGPGQNLSMKGIRIMLSFNGAATTEGHFRAYSGGYVGAAPSGLGSVSCDVGLLVESHAGYITEDCQFVGYWRTAARLVSVVLTNDDTDTNYLIQGGEYQRDYRNTYQGNVGVLVRGADRFKVRAVGSDYVEVTWSDSHTLNSDYTLGKFRVYNGGSSIGVYSYTGQTKTGDVLRLTGVTPNPSGTVLTTHEVSPALTTTALAGMVYNDCVFTGLNHTSLLPSEDLAGLGLKPSACIEVSGRGLRSIVFSNALLRGHDTVAGHFHDAADITFTANSSAENFDGVAATGGSAIGTGMRWIASPAPSANTRVTYPAGATYRFTISEIEATSFSDIRPKYGSSAPTRFSDGSDVGLFEPLLINALSLYNQDGKYSGPTGASRGIAGDDGNLAISYDPVTGTTVIAHNGVNRMAIGQTSVSVARTGSDAININQTGESTVTRRLQRSSGDTSGPEVHVIKTRGTVASPSATQSADSIGGILWRSHDGSALVSVASLIGQASETHSGSGNGTRLRMFTTAAGATSSAETLRVEHSLGLSMYGANPVIDANRHHRFRSYTVGTLPSASPAGQGIYVSDGTSNKRFAISDATNWRFPDGAIVS